MVQLNKRAYAEFDNMVQLKRYYGSTKTPFEPFLKWRRYKREFRTFINSVALEKQMFDGLLRRLLEYSDIPLDERQLLLTGADPEAWHSEKTVKALKMRLGDSYVSCMYILKTMEEDLLELQKMMSLKDGSVSEGTSSPKTELILYVINRWIGRNLVKTGGTTRGRGLLTASATKVLRQLHPWKEATGNCANYWIY
jgi:hypothetical protein